MNSWSLWITQNYKILSTWSKRWSPNEWRDLLSHYTLYLEKNWSKFSLIPDGEERIKFTQTWFKNNVKWSNSDFNKSIEVNNFEEDWKFKEEAEEEPLDIRAEDLSEDLKEFIIDLHRRFSEEEALKIIKIRKIYLSLDTPEKVLYDLYFTQELSIRQVATRLQLPHSSVYVLLIALRKKIKDLCY